MNIQISNIDFNKINSALIKKYFVKQNNITHIFSEANILELRNDGVWRILPEDLPIINVTIGKYEMLIDKSKWIKEETWFQIPTKHIHIKTNQLIYKLNKKSLVQLVIEEEKELITNIFFKTDEIIDIAMIKKDIITFLSILKLY